MRYPYLNRTSKRRVIIPQLKGGINAADHPSYIGDDQLTAAENMYLSSSVVKQIAYFGGDISHFVPEKILDDIKQRLIKER